MKKILILSLMLTVKAAFAQIKAPCPCGGMLVFEITKFNFHKPKTDCLFGFGLCLKMSPIRFECVPCTSLPNGPLSFKQEMVTCYMAAFDQKLELHLPAALLEDESFLQDQAEFFELEDDMLPIPSTSAGESSYVKAGKYPVERRGEELVVSFQ